MSVSSKLNQKMECSSVDIVGVDTRLGCVENCFVTDGDSVTRCPRNRMSEYENDAIQYTVYSILEYILK